MNKLHTERVDVAVRFMMANIDDFELRMKNITKASYVCARMMNEYFINVTGMTPISYLTSMRMVKAQHDLLYTNKLITNIVHDVGFLALGTFCNSFTIRYGLAPTFWRNEKKQRLVEYRQKLSIP